MHDEKYSWLKIIKKIKGSFLTLQLIDGLLEANI